MHPPSTTGRTTLSWALALVAAGCALLLTACGGDGESTSDNATTAESGTCSDVELVAVDPGAAHEDRVFSASDYDTNPPAGGAHNPNALAMGTFYESPPPLGQSVHALEHGAVIAWTNDLDTADQTAVEDAFNEIYDPNGYFQIAVVENPQMDVPFALSSWGAVQKCDSVDTSAILPFIEANYASERTTEGFLACPPPPAKVQIDSCQEADAAA